MDSGSRNPAPDLVWAILGVRSFRTGADGTLISPYQEAHVWNPHINRARCFADPTHGAPERGCGCGFNAWHPDLLRDCLTPAVDVVGAIAAWGEVDVYADGFRASHARPLMLIELDPAGPDSRLPTIAARYALPIVDADALLDVAARSGVHPVPAGLRPPRRPPAPAYARHVPRLNRLDPGWSCVWPQCHIVGELVWPDVVALRPSHSVRRRLTLFTPQRQVTPWIYRGDVLARGRLGGVDIVLRSPLSGKIELSAEFAATGGSLAHVRPALWHRDAASVSSTRGEIGRYAAWAGALDDEQLVWMLS